MSFAHVDRYVGIRLGVDLAEAVPGRTRIVESRRRVSAERSYGYVHGLWWVWLADDRRIVSVPPGAGVVVQAILRDVRSEASMLDDGLAESLRRPVDEALLAAGLRPTDRVFRDQVLACNGALLRPHPLPNCRRLVDDSVPPAEGLCLPTHCFPDGVVYGVVSAGQVVSLAFAHRAGVMEDLVADVGVETAPGHRRQGYAQAVVSALVAHFTAGGGESRYSCSLSNQASLATARSVGFAPYGKSLILSAPRVSEGHQ